MSDEIIILITAVLRRKGRRSRRRLSRSIWCLCHSIPAFGRSSSGRQGAGRRRGAAGLQEQDGTHG